MSCRSADSRVGSLPSASTAQSVRAGGLRWDVLGALSVAGFFVLSLVKILHHVCWRDELRVWSICRASGSLIELARLTRYEGHPGLWYLLVYGLTRLTANPVAMKLLHLVIATAAVYVVVRWSPFSRLQKLLFAFGYFPFFEYGTISRAYGLGLLLVLIACTLLCQPRRRHWAVAMVLALLAQSSVYGIILAAALGLAWASDQWLAWRDGWSVGPGRRRPWGAAAVVAGGILVGCVQVFPGPQPRLDSCWPAMPGLDRVVLTVAVIWRSYVPIPGTGAQFWNSNCLEARPWIMAALSLACAGGTVWLLRGSGRALVLWGSATGVLLLATYARFAGSLRHHGYLFVAVVAAWWLAQAQQARGQQEGLPGHSRWRRGLGGGIVTAVLAVQAVAGLWASSLDLLHPFSAAAEAAEYIQGHFAALPLVGHNDYVVSSLSAYLGRPVYYPSCRAFGTYNLQDGSAANLVNMNELLVAIDRLSGQYHSDVLIVLGPSRHLPSDDFLTRGLADGSPLYRLRWVADFRDSIVADETFTLYLAQRAGEGATR